MYAFFLPKDAYFRVKLQHSSENAKTFEVICHPDGDFQGKSEVQLCIFFKKNTAVCEYPVIFALSYYTKRRNAR